MAKRTKSTRIKDPRGSAKIGGAPRGRTARINSPTRGSSIQGDRQAARGGNAGANQGGASRGASRLEPSTTKKGTGRVSGKRHTQKGRGRMPR